MSIEDNFEFRRRARGVAWVCDIAGSSKHLNNNFAVDFIEQYIPRLHWTAANFVEAAGGAFVKWTGDGFLAWFEMGLHRDLEWKVSGVLNALWHLTVFNNVTRLGLPIGAKFRLRHGVAYEQDALVSKITYPSGHQAIDIIGRGIVLAFRLSGIPSPFPGVAVQGDIATAHKHVSAPPLQFEPWKPSPDDWLRYFKGEAWGTDAIHVSDDTKRREVRNLADTLKHARGVLDVASGQAEVDESFLRFAVLFTNRLREGPSWARAALDEYVAYVRDDLFHGTKQAVEMMEKIINSPSQEPH